MRAWFFICLSILCFYAQSDDRLPNLSFTAYANEQSVIDNALSQAKLDNKLNMFVFGAEWCHDSRAFVENITTEEVKAVTDEAFVVTLIDVGYLQDKRVSMNQFAYPINFATPTVLIIEPNSKQIVNFDSIEKWQYAAQVSTQEFVDYFVSFKDVHYAPAPIPNQIGQLFEQQQVARLVQGYNKLSPMLAASVEGEVIDEEQFIQLWREVKHFRTNLQNHIHQFRKSGYTQTSMLPADLKAKQSWE